MIRHEFHYMEKGMNFSYEVYLPFRINEDDIINNSLFDNHQLMYKKEQTDELITFMCNNEFFDVDYITIDFRGVGVQLKDFVDPTAPKK